MRYDNDTQEVSKFLSNKDLTYCESNIIKQLSGQTSDTSLTDVEKQKINAEITNQCNKAQDTLINDKARNYDILDNIPRPVYTGAYKKDPKTGLDDPEYRTEMCTEIDIIDGKCIPIKYYVPENPRPVISDKNSLKVGDILTGKYKDSIEADKAFIKSAQDDTTDNPSTEPALIGGMATIINKVTEFLNDEIGQRNNEGNGYLPKMEWYTEDYLNKYFPNNLDDIKSNMDTSWTQPYNQLIYGGGYCSKKMLESGNCVPLGSNYMVQVGNEYESTDLEKDSVVEINDNRSVSKQCVKYLPYFYDKKYLSRTKALIYRKEFPTLIQLVVGKQIYTYIHNDTTYDASITKVDLKKQTAAIKYGSNDAIGSISFSSPQTKIFLKNNENVLIKNLVHENMDKKDIFLSNDPINYYKYKVVNSSSYSREILNIESNHELPPLTLNTTFPKVAAAAAAAAATAAATGSNYYLLIENRKYIISSNTTTKTKTIVQPYDATYYCKYNDKLKIKINYKMIHKKYYWIYTTTKYSYYYVIGANKWYRILKTDIKQEKTFCKKSIGKKDLLNFSDSIDPDLKILKHCTNTMTPLSISDGGSDLVALYNILKRDRIIKESTDKNNPGYIVVVAEANKKGDFHNYLKNISTSGKTTYVVDKGGATASGASTQITQTIKFGPADIEKIMRSYRQGDGTVSEHYTKNNAYKNVPHKLTVDARKLTFKFKNGDKVIKLEKKEVTSMSKVKYKVKSNENGYVILVKVDHIEKEYIITKNEKFENKSGLVITITDATNQELIKYSTIINPTNILTKAQRNLWFKQMTMKTATLQRQLQNKLKGKRYMKIDNIPPVKNSDRGKKAARGLAPGVLSDISSIPSELGSDSDKLEWKKNTGNKYVGTSKDIDPLNKDVFIRYLMEKEWWMQNIIRERQQKNKAGKFTRLFNLWHTKIKKDIPDIDTVADIEKNYGAMVKKCRIISGISDYPVSYCARIYYNKVLGEKDTNKYGIPTISMLEKSKYYKMSHDDKDVPSTILLLQLKRFILPIKPKSAATATVFTSIELEHLNFDDAPSTKRFFNIYKSGIKEAHRFKGGYFKESFIDLDDDNESIFNEKNIFLLIVFVMIIIYIYNI